MAQGAQDLASGASALKELVGEFAMEDELIEEGKRSAVLQLERTADQPTQTQAAHRPILLD
jgi:hypothetical protein